MNTLRRFTTRKYRLQSRTSLYNGYRTWIYIDFITTCNLSEPPFWKLWHTARLIAWKIEFSMFTHHPTNVSGRLAKPERFYLLQETLYVARWTIHIYGDILQENLLQQKLERSTLDPRVLLSRCVYTFFHLWVILNDIVFASNNPKMTTHLKNCTSTTFDIQLYGQLAFILW